MAIALVQTATQVNVAGSSTTAPTIAINGVTGGNAIVPLASIWDNNTTWTLTNTTDGGNTYTTRQALADNGSSEGKAVVAHAVNVTGGNRTVAFNLAGTSGAGGRYYVLGCLEFSGVATSAAEDDFAVNENIDTSATDISAGGTGFTTTDAGDVIVGSACDNCSDTTLNFASPTSWTNRYRQNDSNTYIGHDSGYWLPAATQTNYTAQWTHDNNVLNIGAGVVVALKPAAGGGGGGRLVNGILVNGLLAKGLAG